MPIHDWTRVDAGIFHDFHHAWIEEIHRALNSGLLSTDYYALAELHSADTLTAETDLDFYRRKQKVVAVRHVSGDRIVAIIEIVSPGNKSSRKAISDFVTKAGELLDRGIHLLIVDLHPPGPRDPQGIHAVIWEDIAGQAYSPPQGKPLTLASYECDLALRTYVREVAVGDELVDMPLFLDRRLHVEVPLEKTYAAAFAVLPRRWQSVLEPAAR